MSLKLLGYRKKEDGTYAPEYLPGRFMDGIPFKNPPEAQDKGLLNPWGGTIRYGDADESKLANNTIYIPVPVKRGGGVRVEYDFEEDER